MILPPLQMQPHPALPTRSKVNDREIKRACLLRMWRGNGGGNRGARKQDPQMNITSTNRIGADPCDTETRLETRQGAGREPRDQHGELDMAERDGTCPKRKKENTGRLKKEVPKKIKARASAWRNKRNKNRKWRKYKDQSKR